MTKVLVKMKGPWELIDGRHIASKDRPSVMPASNFIQQRVAAKQVSIITDLQEAATDPEFEKYWNETKDKEGKADEKLAVDAFVSKYGPDAPEVIPETDEERLVREQNEFKEAKRKQDEADAAKAKADKALADAAEDAAKKEKEAKDAKAKADADKAKADADALEADRLAEEKRVAKEKADKEEADKKAAPAPDAEKVNAPAETGETTTTSAAVKRK